MFSHSLCFLKHLFPVQFRASEISPHFLFEVYVTTMTTLKPWGILHEPQLDGVLSPVWCQLKGKMERFYHLWSMMWTESITRISGLRTKEISSVISEPKNQKGRRCTSLSAIQNGTRGPLWRMLNWLNYLSRPAANQTVAFVLAEIRRALTNMTNGPNGGCNFRGLYHFVPQLTTSHDSVLVVIPARSCVSCDTSRIIQVHDGLCMSLYVFVSFILRYFTWPMRFMRWAPRKQDQRMLKHWLHWLLIKVMTCPGGCRKLKFKGICWECERNCDGNKKGRSGCPTECLRHRWRFCSLRWNILQWYCLELRKQIIKTY